MKPSSQLASPRVPHLLAVLAIIAVCVGIYSNAVDASFQFDDFPNIVENPHVRVTSFDLPQLYEAAFASPSRRRPVANLSFGLNYLVGKYDVRGYHIVNIAVHGINGILVYLLALATFRRALPGAAVGRAGLSTASMALFAALVFTAHPVQTESVTYVVQRMTSLAATFYLLSLLLYVIGRSAHVPWRRWTSWAGSFAAWVLALGTKPIAAILPFIVLLYEWYFFRGPSRGELKRNLAYAGAASLLFGLAAFVYFGGNPFTEVFSAYSHRDFTMGQRVLTQFRVVAFYISLVLFPHPSRLNLDHHISTSRSLLDPGTTLLSLLALVGLIGLALHLARKERLISFCIVWFCLTLAIESSVVGLEMVFEHRLYLPMLGVSLAAAKLLFASLSAWRPVAVAVAAAIVLALGVATHARNEVWQDRITLWSDVVRKSPRHARAHNNLGNALNDQGRREEALDHYAESLRLAPGSAVVHFNFGLALERLGEVDRAVEEYRKALGLDARQEEARVNLAQILRRRGDLDAAIGHYQTILRFASRSARAHAELGILHGELGNADLAAAHLVEATRIDPEDERAKALLEALRLAHPEVVARAIEGPRSETDRARSAAEHVARGDRLARGGALAQAREHYARALGLDPEYAAAHLGMGNTRLLEGELDDAIESYERAAALQPTWMAARLSLASAFARKGRPAKVIEHAREALRIGDDPDAHLFLAEALSVLGRTSEAEEHYREVLRIDPRSDRARAGLERFSPTEGSSIGSRSGVSGRSEK